MNAIRANAVVVEHFDASLAAMSEPQDVGGYLLNVVDGNGMQIVAEASAKAFCDRDANWTTRLITYVVNQARLGNPRACALVSFWGSYAPQLRDVVADMVTGVEEVAQFAEIALRSNVWLGVQAGIMGSLAGTAALHPIGPQLDLLTQLACQTGDFFVARLAEVGRIVHEAAMREGATEIDSACEPLKSRIHNLMQARKQEQQTSADSIAAKDRQIAVLTASLASCVKEREDLAKTCEAMTSTSLNAEKQLLVAKIGELTASASTTQAELEKARFDTQYERLAREEAEQNAARLKKLLIRNDINPYPTGEEDMPVAA